MNPPPARYPLLLMTTALAPLIWGSTYLVTTEFLPPDRPFHAALLRCLPAGLLLLLVGTFASLEIPEVLGTGSSGRPEIPFKNLGDDMGLGQVYHVDVVPYAGAIRRVVVIAEDTQLLADTRCGLRQERNEVLRNADG